MRLEKAMDRRLLARLLGGVGVALVGWLTHTWFLTGAGLAAIALTLLLRVWAVKAGPDTDRTAAQVGIATGLMGLGAVALGAYALTLGGGARVMGVVAFVVLLIPAAYFLLISWAAFYHARTGARPPQADRIGAFFARLNEPIRRRRG